MSLEQSSAVELARLVRERQVSASELLEAHLRRIERLNPSLNAIVSLVPEQAIEAAAEVDRRLARGEDVGPLAGLPMAVKDLVLTRGITTTSGSRIFRDFVPDQDALTAERLRAAGAVLIGKTNVPEFGAGSQTYNEVFGATRNPWDHSKTPGGSSGGAAAALSAGLVPLADGSDMGGSLRNPASFCNVVGLRPSPGRVPSWPAQIPWQPLAVEGPMARSVADAALLLSALAGPDPRSPIAIEEPGKRFADPLERSFKGVRIAWSDDLGGLPVDRRVTAALADSRDLLTSLGCEVDLAVPDFRGADEAFTAWRAWMMEATLGGLLDQHPDLFKETLRWNIEQGRALTGPQLGAAELARNELTERVRRFMADYDFLALPVSQVPPFDARVPYPTEIEGTPMETYIDWMRSCYYVSVLGLPAISVPAGFTDDGLPVGLQIVGRHHDDFGVLQLAHAIEQANGLTRRRPGTGRDLI